LGRELDRDVVHAHFGIDQDVRRIGLELGAPALDRERPADEALAQSGRRLGLRVRARVGRIAEQPEPGAIELAEPALDRDLPVRMVTEESADDADPDGLFRLRRWRERRRRIALRHDPADEFAIARLQLAVVLSLVGEIERLLRTD